MSFFQNILSRIKQIGISNDLSLYNKERIVIINIWVFVCTIVAFNISIICLITSVYEHLIYAFINLCSFCTVLFLNNQRKYLLASIVYVLGSNFSVINTTLSFGYDSGFYMYYFSTPITMFLFFTKNQKIYRVLSLLFYFISFCILNILNYYNLLIPEINISHDYVFLLNNVNILGSIMLTMILVLFFSSLEFEFTVHESKTLRAQNKALKLEEEYKQLELFNYVVSHNLKGPLGRIKSLTNFLKSGNEINSTEVLGHLSESVEKLDEMIVDLNQILLDKKKGQEAQSLVSFKELIDDIKVNLVDEINQSEALIIYAGDDVAIKSIKSIWLSILQNLISNSIKYRIQNEPLIIEIICEISKSKINMQVIDNGLGIDLKLYKNKVFQLYNRFHENIPGKGMGLYLVQNHINMLNGKVEIYSSPNKGCKFEITVPLNNN